MQVRSSFTAITVLFYIGLAIWGCQNKTRQDAQRFIDSYTDQYVGLKYAASLAEWQSNIRTKSGGSPSISKADSAKAVLNRFLGNTRHINVSGTLLRDERSLTNLQVRQLETILFQSAHHPETLPKLSADLTHTEHTQMEALRSAFLPRNKENLSSDFLRILQNESSLDKRLKAWELSKQVGEQLKKGLKELRSYRNEIAKAMGYEDYFDYKASEYGMTSVEMVDLTRKINSQLHPLFKEIHTYVRYALAEKLNQNVPDYIPAHWLPDPWGQDWSALSERPYENLNEGLAEKGSEWIIEQAERFFISMGFPALPEQFYIRSSLYPSSSRTESLTTRVASAWHMDLDQDVRAIMNIEANAYWYQTTHKELAHIYYFLQYSESEIPVLLRRGANRAFHESMGLLMGFAAMQPRLIEELGFSEKRSEENRIHVLLEQALKYVVLIPWSAGVVTEFEYQLYAEELPADRWNEVWRNLKGRHQGIQPPFERNFDFCDPAAVAAITKDAAQYYDTALSVVLLFQFHDYIAKNILKEDFNDVNYFGNNNVGYFLKSIMRKGATQDWRELLRQAVGEEISAEYMVAYFKPLYRWLKKQNQGKEHSLPES